MWMRSKDNMAFGNFNKVEEATSTPLPNPPWDSNNIITALPR